MVLWFQRMPCPATKAAPINNAYYARQSRTTSAAAIHAPSRPRPNSRVRRGAIQQNCRHSRQQPPSKRTTCRDAEDYCTGSPGADIHSYSLSPFGFGFVLGSIYGKLSTNPEIKTVTASHFPSRSGSSFSGIAFMIRSSAICISLQAALAFGRLVVKNRV
jgi:hypothetical protein